MEILSVVGMILGVAALIYLTFKADINKDSASTYFCIVL